MSSLMERMMKVSAIKGRGEIMADSTFFAEKDYVQTGYPIIDIAFSGRLDGGLTNGLTILAGESKTFKSMTALLCMAAYLRKYPDGFAILYDSEFGITNEYLEGFGIDTSRVYHLPIINVEELKFDMAQRLKEVEKGDRLFIMIDSIGNLASLKEATDAEDGKSVADMTRAKQFKSLFRIVTPHLTTKNIPCIAIAHTYTTMEMYSKAIISGGTGLMYSANQAFIISKAQEKEGTDLKGWRFTLNVEKSRFVKEKSKLPFTVLYDSGIQKYSALFELAREANLIDEVSKGWYATTDPDTGEVHDVKLRRAAIEKDKDFFEALIKSERFNTFVQNKYKLQGGVQEPEDMDDEEEGLYDE